MIEITLNGIRCLNWTIDNMFEVDGKGDEIYFTWSVSHHTADGGVATHPPLPALAWHSENQCSGMATLDLTGRPPRGQHPRTVDGVKTPHRCRSSHLRARA